MKFFNISLMALTLMSFSANADEVSKKACQQFLPALGANNIDLILNGIKRDYKVERDAYRGDDKPEKRFFEILKSVDELVSDDAQKRCDAGLYPIMNLDVCYMKCDTEVEKALPGKMSSYYKARWAMKAKCNDACTGAYVAQNAITKTIRKTLAEATQCGTSTNVVDTRKSKQIENILLNIDQGQAAKATEK